MIGLEMFANVKSQITAIEIELNVSFMIRHPQFGRKKLCRPHMHYQADPSQSPAPAVGLGREIALVLASKGYAVFGTAISEAETQELRNASNGRVRLTICDMTKEAAVQAWASDVSDALGDAGLNLLINNAGILTPGPMEVFVARRHPARVRRQCLRCPVGHKCVSASTAQGTRSHRPGQHLDGSLPLPFNGPSGASKAAMEVFSAVYRAELKSLFPARCRTRRARRP